MQQNGFAVGDAFWGGMEDEIIDQAAVDVKYLRSDTARSSSHIRRSELRDVSLQLAYLGRDVRGATLATRSRDWSTPDDAAPER